MKFIHTLELCFIILASQLVLVYCHSSGAPVESCDTLSPSSTFHGATEQTSSVPFEIDTSMFKNPYSDELHYSPNSSYEITLQPKRCSIGFRGFLIQARLTADDTTIVGSFASPSDGDNYRLSSCARRAGSVTHSSVLEMTSISILWTSPPPLTGNIRFRYTIIHSSKVYWADQRTAVLIERQCPIPLYWDSSSSSCVAQCPLFTFGNHTLAQCQPFPNNILNKHVHCQADATAYFGSVQVNAMLGTKIFDFRIVIDLSLFNNDLNAIIVRLVRSNLVEKIFSLSDGQIQRTFLIHAKGGIDEVNASRIFPEIRLIENRRVVFEDHVIYQKAPPSNLELPAILDFDLNLIIVGEDSIVVEELLPFAVGTVALILPLDSSLNDTYTNTTSENLNMDDFNCSQIINGCETSPCQNDATCINFLHGSFSCHCNAGWTGDLCDTDIDYCALDSSLHGPCDDIGATNCTDGNSTYGCSCTVGFTGYNCSEDINECEPNPCKNGATCTDGNSIYSCACAVGFTGYNCSEDIDECDPNPCENGGSCTNLLHGLYECDCPRGLSGEICNSVFDVCAPSQPCRNDSICTRGMYNCKCLCIAQCPLFTFGNHSTGDCQAFPEDFGGVQADASAYYGSVQVNAVNGTAIFPLRLVIDLKQFDNDLEFVNLSLVQNIFAERIFEFSNYQQQQQFPISRHGGIDVVNASNIFPEITLIENRIVVYEDYIIYSYEDTSLFSNVDVPSLVDFDLNVIILGKNSGNTEERTPFAVGTVALIQDLPPVNSCQSDIDDTWGIAWPSTLQSSNISQPCSGNNSTGLATRYCDGNGEWSNVDIVKCVSIPFHEIEYQAEIILKSKQQVIKVAELTWLLAQATQPQNHSLFPRDLEVSSRVLSTVVNILEANNITNDYVIDALNNVLDDNNREGWTVLQTHGMMMAGELLLLSAERYAFLVAISVNITGGEYGVQAFRRSRHNIAITGRQYNEPPSADIHFPTRLDLINYTKSGNTATIRIPSSLIQERLKELKEGGNLPVSFALLRNLPVNSALSNTSTQTTSTCRIEQKVHTILDQDHHAMLTSDVITAQVGATGPTSLSLQRNPIGLNFSFEMTMNSTSSYHRCGYWNFSDPIGSGSWASDGVMTNDIDVSEGNTTIASVQCTSTHLTSFAVLVNVAGGLKDIDEIERTAHNIVSYIGCAVSIICLTLTMVFFIWRGKLFNSKSVLFFIHFNLAASLLVAILAFVFGIETASGNMVACAFVAALLHYLFLSAFCWMLCEGIMLYLLLHIVFSDMAKKRWPFIIIGYLTPLPIVIITAGIRFNDYGVRDEFGNLLYCWLSTQHGTVFGFVAPMLVIIAINALFLVLALHAVWKTKKRSLAKGEHEYSLRVAQKLGKAVFIGSLVLLPLLGLTWVFGILAVNENSKPLAWIFTIFNSSQGLFIFVFHVLQSNEVRSKINSKLCSKRKAALRSITYARWHSTPRGSIATLSGIGTKEMKVDQTKTSSFALATECDTLDETLNNFGSIATSLEKGSETF